MADVVESLGHFYVERRIGGDVERLARIRGLPLGAVLQTIAAAAGHAFHDFGRSRAKSQGRWQHHANGFFLAAGGGEAVADALAVKVHIGLGCQGHIAEGLSCHDLLD